MSKNMTERTTPNGNNLIVDVFIFVALIGLAIVQAGCAAGTAAVAGAPQANSAETKIEPKRPETFYKIVVEADRSTSTEKTRTPPMTMAQIESLIAIVREKSGELAFGFIDEDSNQPFLRLRLDPRPAAPARPDSKNNPFDQERQLNKYKIDMHNFKVLDARWQAEMNRRTEEFRTAAQTMIDCLHNKKCKAGNTDVSEAVRRADLFLSEAEKSAPVGIMLLVTDGQETLKPKAPPPQLKSQPHILVVNGSASLGILDSYKPLAFEGIDAAIRHMNRIQPAPLAVASDETRKL